MSNMTYSIRGVHRRLYMIKAIIIYKSIQCMAEYPDGLDADQPSVSPCSCQQMRVPAPRLSGCRAGQTWSRAAILDIVWRRLGEVTALTSRNTFCTYLCQCRCEARLPFEHRTRFVCDYNFGALKFAQKLGGSPTGFTCQIWQCLGEAMYCARSSAGYRLHYNSLSR
jgi:hypothetical protein